MTKRKLCPVTLRYVADFLERRAQQLYDLRDSTTIRFTETWLRRDGAGRELSMFGATVRLRADELSKPKPAKKRARR